MATVKTSSATAEMLAHLYKNVKMGADSLRAMLPKIEGEDAKFKSDVTLQLSQYETFAARINTMLSEEGGEEHSDSMMRRMSAKLTMALGTLTDSSVSHLADMIIQGATVSITDTTRILREYENTTAAEAAIALARDIIRTEEESIERMRGYL